MGKQGKKKKNLIRDAMTGKPIRPNQEVILVENLVDYARKLGYIISNYKMAMMMMFTFLLIMGMASAEYRICDGSIFTDIDSPLNECTLASYEQIYSSIIKTKNISYLQFDGVNDYITIDDFDRLSPSDTGNITISVWVNMPTLDVPNGVRTGIVSKGTSGNYEYEIRIDDTTGNVRMVGFTPSASTYCSVSTGFSVTPNTWHNLVATITNATDCKMYVDGKYRAIDSTISGVMANGNSDLLIGVGTNLGNDFNGSIDEIQIWDKELSPKQIRGIYNESKYGSNLGYGIPSLSYHQIVTPATASTIVTPTDFQEQMQYLSNNGYETITYDDYYQWKNNNGSIPEKPIILVFDDAFQNVYYNALPVMDTYGFKGVFGIITSQVGKTARVNWDQLTEMKGKGWQIASHSNDSNPITGMSDDAALQAFTISKQIIDGNLSQDTSLFIYPQNANDDDSDYDCASVYDMCSGSSSGPTTNEWFLYKSAHPTLESSFGMRRIIIYNDTTMQEFGDTIGKHNSLILDLRLGKNTGTTVYDRSDLANNGEITGAQWYSDNVNNTLNVGDYTTTNGRITLLNPDYIYHTLDYNLTIWYNATEEHLQGAEIFEIEYNNFYAMIFLVLFVFAGGMFMMRLYVFSGVIFSLIGFTLLFSGFNIIIAFTIIVGGVLALFVGK